MKHRSKLWFVLASLVLAAAVLAGCMNNGNGNNNLGTRQQGTSGNQQAAPIRQQADRNNGKDQIAIADQAAQRVAALNGIRQANVLVTRNNAYVAALTTDGQGKLTREVEDQIAAKVREVDPTIRNVYVSTNPDFVDRINTYVSDVQQGRPVAGFVEQFNEMVQRLFPNAR